MGIVIKHNPCDSMRLTGSFGADILNGQQRWHDGVDFGALKAGVAGDNIYAINDGTVRLVKNDINGYGDYIVIEHREFCSLYAHLSKVNVFVGQKVSAGDIIGLMGFTGLVSPRGQAGTHLHLEIRDCLYYKFWEKSENKYKHAIDPQPLLSKIKTDREKVQEHFGFDNNTMTYLDKHPHFKDLYMKLSKDYK